MKIDFPPFQDILNFGDPKLINWTKYMESYCLGTKQYVLKEELSELPRARKTLQRLVQFYLKIFDGALNLQ
jgi:fatty acyl-CoA reductase